MLKRASIKNFMSLKNVVLQFTDGLNVITGDTDSGKSAFFHALRWAFLNKPSGFDFKTWDATNPTEVQVSLNNGTFVHRRGVRNQYIMGDTIFSAIRTEVPEEILSITKIDESNFQDQFAPNFLLNDTAGQISQIFNKVSGLSIIDEMRAEIDRRIRFEKREIETIDSQIEDHTNRIRETDEYEPSLIFVKALLSMLQDIEANQATLNRIQHLVRQVQNDDYEIKRCDEILSKTQNINRLIELSDEIDSNLTLKNDIEKLVLLIKAEDARIESFNEQLKSITSLDELVENKAILDGLKDELKHINILISRIDKERLEITNADNEKERLVKTYGDLLSNFGKCPTCFHKIDQDQIDIIMESMANEIINI